jgi:hypothetical protein
MELSTATRRVSETGGFAGLLRLSLAGHGLYWALVAAFGTGLAALKLFVPEVQIGSFWEVMTDFLAFSIPFMLLCLAMMRFYLLARYHRPKHPLAALGRDLKAFLSDPPRLAHGLPMVAILLLFMFVFVTAKANVPVIGGFAWDPALAEADRLLFLGHHPWELLQPILGYWPVTFAINVIYNSWFVVMWIIWLQLAFAREASLLRTRFFLTFFLTWIVGGSILAMLMSSAGPCYFGRLGLAPDPYHDLMAYLRGVNEIVPVWGVSLQDILWNSYASHSTTVGISAMPSMHNGTALLFALTATQISRPWGKLIWAQTAVIFVGSIHLGWHYAVDGILAFGLTFAVWQWSMPLVRWWHKTETQQRLGAGLAGAGKVDSIVHAF